MLMLAFLTSILLSGVSCACTAVYVGKEASSNGTYMLARTNDLWGTDYPCRFDIAERVENAPGRTVKGANGFTWQLPDTTYKYTAIPLCASTGYGYEASAAGNECGLAITGSVTAYICDAAAKADPVVSDGAAEESLTQLLAASCKNAREAVRLAAEIIDTTGNAEQNIYMFADKEEAWYMEMYTGHQYAAVKMPDDMVSVFGNQFMLEHVDPEKDEAVVSPGLFELPEKEGFAVYDEDGRMNLFRTYSGGAPKDYSNLRTWRGHMLLAASTAGEYETGKMYPLFFKPDREIAVRNIFRLLRDRYEGTEYCPETSGRTDVRPISIERASSVHVLEVDPSLPDNMSVMTWAAMSQAEFSVFVPLSNAETALNAAYAKNTEQSGQDLSMAYYNFKNLNTAAASDRDRLAANVRGETEAFENYEVMRWNTLKRRIRKGDIPPGEAVKCINSFCKEMQTSALGTAKLLSQS